MEIVFAEMSQNISSRRQELLSRLKTTLAIVSQATGFDNERPAAGELRPVEQPSYSVRDPRLRRQETYNEGSGVSEPGSSTAGSVAVPSTASSSATPSSNVLHKFDEIQDEDEFLYGSSVSEGSSRQQQQLDSSQDKSPDEQRAVHLQWATQRPVREEEPQWAAGAPAGRQQGYTDPFQPVSQHAGDARWMGNTDSTRSGRISDQPQWAQATSQKGDGNSWGGSMQTLKYSGGDDRQSVEISPQMAPSRNVGMQPESAASKLQGINAGMLEGILKLVASGSTSSASQPMPPPQQQQQPSFPSYGYGSGYPPQTVYNQPLDQRSYVSSVISSDVPSGAVMYGQPSQFQQHTSYNYSQSALPPQQLHMQHMQQQQQLHIQQQPLQHYGIDTNPLLSQLPTTFIDNKMAQTSNQLVTGQIQRYPGLLEQANSRGQSLSFRPVATSLGSHFVGSQPADRPVIQQNVPASTPPQSSMLEKPPTSVLNMYPVGHEVARPVAAPQPERTAVMEPDKGESGLAKSEVDKDTLSRLLNMIGCSSNVTSLMQELIKKDDQEKSKKQPSPAPQTVAPQTVAPQTVASQTPAHQDSSPVPPAAAAAELQKTENDSVEPATTNMPHTPPEPAVDSDSTGDDEKEASLPPESAKETEAEETIPVLSSLSRLQKNYDSPDENAEKESATASKTEDTKSSSPSSQVASKDNEWERSTEEFLRRLQSKPTAPTQSQKEKSRSTSRDRIVKDKPKTKVAESKKMATKQSESEAKKVQGRDAGSEVSAAEIESERADLLRGKHEIEGALELLQKELLNLRTNKKRLLESPSGAQRNEELANSIADERKLTDHMSQLKNAMSELNEHLEKLSATKVRLLSDYCWYYHITNANA